MKKIFTLLILSIFSIVAAGNFLMPDEAFKPYAKVTTAGETSGESLWRMPLTDEHKSDMNGKYADLSNMAPARGAGSATAAGFLQNFVEDGIPFCHLDMAGTAWNSGARKSYHNGNSATGVLVRTFYEFVKAI